MSGALDVRTSVPGVSVWIGEVAQLCGRWQASLSWLLLAVSIPLLLHKERRGAAVLLVVAMSLLTGVLLASATQARATVPAALVEQTLPLQLVVDRPSKPSASQRWSLATTIVAAGPTPLAARAILMTDTRSDWPVGSTLGVRGVISPGKTPLSYFVSVRGPPNVAPPQGLAAAAAEVRSGLLGVVRERAGGALVAGLTVGDESLQSAELAASMQQSGLAHLTAVSGGNIAIVLLLTWGVVRFFTPAIAPQVCAGTGAILGYSLLVGPQPSLLRAALMGAVLVFSLIRGGPTTGLPALGTAVWLLLLLDPGLAVSLGFLLSVVATAGLILLTPVVTSVLRRAAGIERLPRSLVQAAVVAPVAYLATLPVLAAHGLATSLSAIPANLLAAPAVPLVTVSGLLATVAAPASQPLAQLLVVPGLEGAVWIERVAEVFGG